jgi:hypothetical protein
LRSWKIFPHPYQENTTVDNVQLLVSSQEYVCKNFILFQLFQRGPRDPIRQEHDRQARAGNEIYVFLNRVVLYCF